MHYTLENSLAASYRTKHYLCVLAVAPLDVYLREMKACVHIKYGEVTQVFFSRGMEHLYCGILSSNTKEQVLILSITWVDLKGLLQREKSQSQRFSYCRVPLPFLK